MRLWPAAGLLLLGLGCEPSPRQEAIYAPREAGLTLVYQQLDLPATEQANQRIQRRVQRTEETPKGLKVTYAHSSFQGVQEAEVTLRNGGVFLGADPDQGATILPEGFPDRVSQWQQGSVHCRVVGFARPDLPGVNLPPEARGVWVEARMGDGQLQRVLYLPDLGEAEVALQKEGRWVTTLRLVSRGFTPDPPSPKHSKIR